MTSDSRNILQRPKILPVQELCYKVRLCLRNCFLSSTDPSCLQIFHIQFQIIGDSPYMQVSFLSEWVLPYPHYYCEAFAFCNLFYPHSGKMNCFISSRRSHMGLPCSLPNTICIILRIDLYPG